MGIARGCGGAKLCCALNWGLSVKRNTQKPPQIRIENSVLGIDLVCSMFFIV